MPDATNAAIHPVHRLLEGSPLRDGYRLSFLANYLTGPVYAGIEKDFGLTRPEYLTLTCLCHRDGLAAKDVSMLAGYPKNSISRAVHLLLGKKLIERRGDPADRRSATLHATAAGRNLYRSTVSRFVDQQERMLDTLTPAERRRLQAILYKLIEASPAWIEEFRGVVGAS